LVLKRLGQNDEAVAEARLALAIVADQPVGSWYRAQVERAVSDFAETEPSEET
jgi:hypothetical protein